MFLFSHRRLAAVVTLGKAFRLRKADRAMTRFGTVACLALLLPLAACSAAASPLPKVGVSMYSGRPDPAPFSLTREQAEAFSACLKAGTVKTTAPVPGELGFRFFSVTGLEPYAILVGVDGAWLDKAGIPTPIAVCPSGFSILRTAAGQALGQAEAGGIPEA